jgi:citrate synthase
MGPIGVVGRGWVTMDRSFSQKDYWNTRISEVEADKVWIRGHDQDEIVRQWSFAEGLFITLKGRRPSTQETRMLNALLNSLLDHGFFSAPIPIARMIISTNPQVIPAIAGGLLSCGTYAVSPQEPGEFIEWASSFMKERGLDMEGAAQEIVALFRREKRRIPGIGHPIHRDKDPRAVSLLAVAEECGFAQGKVKLFLAIHREFVRASGKSLPINVDGMMACIMSEMGLNPVEMVGINIVSHLPGIVAHVVEELHHGYIARGIPLALITGPDGQGSDSSS